MCHLHETNGSILTTSNQCIKLLLFQHVNNVEHFIFLKIENQGAFYNYMTSEFRLDIFQVFKNQVASTRQYKSRSEEYINAQR